MAFPDAGKPGKAMCVNDRLGISQYILPSPPTSIHDWLRQPVCNQVSLSKEGSFKE